MITASPVTKTIQPRAARPALPSICGIIGNSVSNSSEATLRQMAAVLGVEEPKVLLHAKSAFKFGLAFSESVENSYGFDPVWNNTKDVCLWLSGELFDDVGAPSPASLLRRFEREGRSFLEKLNGWFAGLLLDLPNDRLLLFNDRYGLGRFYYYQNSEGLFFALQAKALLAVVPELRSLDEQSVAEWLSCGCVLQNRTLLRGISVLPPGSCWSILPNGKISKDSYFEPSTWETQPVLSTADYEERLTETFAKVLPRYFCGGATAMSLTGGLDGRMIMAWADQEPGQLPCFTFNGPYRECADMRIARRVARVCGQSHQTISVGHDFLTQFPRLAEQSVSITDGAMDVTGAAELYVNRLACEIAPVRLTGNYGSEILRRNIAFKPRALPAELFTSGMRDRLNVAAKTYSEEARDHRLSFIAFKQVPWHHFARFAIERSQINVRSPYLDNDLVALSYQAPPEVAMSLEPYLRLIAAGSPELARIPTDRGLVYPPPTRVINRLRHMFYDYVAKAEYAYDYGMPQWLAGVDHALGSLHLERLFLGRQKFCHFRIWYRDQLASYISQVLLDVSALSRPYINRTAVERMVTDHIRGTRNATVELHKLLSLELLHHTLLEGP